MKSVKKGYLLQRLPQKTKRFSSLLLIAFLCFYSCQKIQKLPPKKQTLRLSFSWDPLTLDPRRTSDPASVNLHHMLYRGLTHLEEDGSISNDLIKSYKTNKLKTHYTFRLKKTSWSDGTPLTAHDFERSWKELMSPDFPSPTASLLYMVQNAKLAKQGLVPTDEVGVQALDNQTLVVKLERPTPYFLQTLACSALFPYPQTNSGKIFNGPFKLDTWLHDRELKLSKNKLYHKQKEVSIKRLSISIIHDEKTAFQLFEKGQIDWLGGFFSPLPLDASRSIHALDSYHYRASSGTTFMVFNTEDSFFSNRNIRKAFYYAVNREMLVDNITQFGEYIAHGITPTILLPLQKERPSNPEKAKIYFQRGLDELGMTRDQLPKITYSFFATELQRKLAYAMQNEWREHLGVIANLREFDFKVYLDKIKMGDFEIAQMSWISQFYDPINFLDRLYSKHTPRNYSNWDSPQYRAILEESNLISHPQKRLSHLLKAESLIAHERPFGPIYHYNTTYLQATNLEGVAISPTGEVYFDHAHFIMKSDD